MCCTDFLQVYWSLYFDHWMKNIVHKVVPLYVKSAEILIDDWLTHSFPNKLPPGSILFIYMHFISMYSNIDTDHGITVARNFFKKFADRLPEDCSTEFVLDALELIMRNNIFQFGDTNWLQLIGCAMGILLINK